LRPTAVELADAIRRGERSPVEVVEEQIELIERIDPWLNSVVVRRFEEARAEARAAERTPATGPLHGVPVTVKEALEMKGLPFTNGSLLEADVTGRSDAPAVQRLRAAGAIVLGKTNLSEFCCFYDSDNLVYGRTVNPHDPERTPGGSSGGEAAAVASGLSYLGVGSDLGSSVRQPAAWCGVFGLKPSRGLVSNAGHAGFGIPPAFGMFACVGPLARSAADLELGLRAMAGTEPAPARPERLAIGVYEDDGLQAVAGSCRAAVRRAADALALAGHKVSAAAPPRQAEARDAYDLMVGSELALYVPEFVAGREQELSRYGREMFEQLRGFSPGLRPYTEAGRTLTEIGAEASEWFERHPVALCPTVPVSAPLAAEGIVSIDGEPPRPGGKLTLCTYANAVGLPAASVPAGRDEAGLPLAVQVIADRGRDLDVLMVAAELERALGGALDPAESPLNPLA
jgi:Asp-tRNA(Asn)/Glu-tRNA(Gln) amidotransferase A subunit family amidase